MCLNPRKIRNNKLNFNPLCDRIYNLVPCCRCEECQNRIRNDYVCRSIAELLDCYDSNGSCYYVTLTYDDKFLPRIDGLPAVDVNILQKFFKRLRKAGLVFRYLLSTEYGENCTKRTHHHAIFFVYNNFSGLSVQSLIDSKWQQGFTYFGRNKGVVESVDALSYVSKYIAKDYSIVNIYQDSKSVFSKVNMSYSSKNPLTFNNVHLQSEFYGYRLVKLCTFENLVLQSINLPEYSGKKNSEIKYKTYRLPFYVERKLMYDTYINDNGNISFKLNSFGVSVLKSRYYINFEKFKYEFSEFASSLDNTVYPFFKKDFLSSFFKNIVPNIDLSSFYFYRLFSVHATKFCLTNLDDYYSEKLKLVSTDVSSRYFHVNFDILFDLVNFLFSFWRRTKFYISYEQMKLNYNSLQNWRVLNNCNPKYAKYKYPIYSKQLSFEEYTCQFNYSYSGYLIREFYRLAS